MGAEKKADMKFTLCLIKHKPYSQSDRGTQIVKYRLVNSFLVGSYDDKIKTVSLI